MEQYRPYTVCKMPATIYLMVNGHAMTFPACRYCWQRAGKGPRLQGRQSALVKTDSKQLLARQTALVSAITSTQPSSTQLGSSVSSEATVPVLSHGLIGPAVSSEAVVIALYTGSGRYNDLPAYSPSPFAHHSVQRYPVVNTTVEERGQNQGQQQQQQQQVHPPSSTQPPSSGVQQLQQQLSLQPSEQGQKQRLLTGQGRQQGQQQQQHVPVLQARVSLVNTLSRVLSGTSRTFSQLRLAPAPSSALAHMDQKLPLVSQLGVVLLVAVFVLYPSWVQASLGIFACYTIDDGTGLYPENQKVGEIWEPVKY